MSQSVVTPNTQIINLEEFKTQADKDLVYHTGMLLQKYYPGYLWGVRLIASPALIGFNLGELIQFGDNHMMVIHPKDCPTRHDFDMLVKKYGGELLERAKLSREESKNEVVLKRPDGFHEKFDESIRLKKIALK